MTDEEKAVEAKEKAERKAEQKRRRIANRLAAEAAIAFFGKMSPITADLLDLMKTIGRQEARNLVDAYYTFQDIRIETMNRLDAAYSGKDEQPCRVLAYVAFQTEGLENQLKRALLAYVQGRPEGRWLLGRYGMGPVLSAGIIAYIDMLIAKTPGHIYSFAGLDPSKTWLGGKKTEALLEGLGISNDGGTVLAQQ